MMDGTCWAAPTAEALQYVRLAGAVLRSYEI
jgi:hypothetical protein